MTVPQQHKRGATITGYGLVVGLIAVVAIAATTGIGSSVTNLFTDVGGKMDDVVQDNVTIPTPAATPSPSGSPTGIYAAFDFEGNFTQTGFGTDVTITSYGSHVSFSSAQATSGSQSVYMDSTDSGSNASRLQVTLPQLLTANHYEIRIDARQNNTENDEGFPSLMYFGRDAQPTSSNPQSYFVLRWGPTATFYGAVVGADGTNSSAVNHNISAQVGNNTWQTLTLRYDNGVGTILAGSTVLVTGPMNTPATPYANDILVIGQAFNLAGDNGYQGFIDRLEVEIFE